MLHKGADVNIHSKYKRTGLMLAAQNGFRKCVKLLLESGANVKCQTKMAQQA